MSVGGGLRRMFSRAKPPPVLDPVGYRLPSYLVDSPSPSPLPPLPPGPLHAGGPPRVRLMMSDGTVEALPQDPELERRAAYLVRSMLAPPPPPPPPVPPPEAQPEPG